MEEEIHPVTVSEWKSLHRRLGDLENVVSDLKLKLDRQDQILNRHGNLETQSSKETVEGVGAELNIQRNLTSAEVAPRSGDLPGQSTIQEEQQEQRDETLTLTSVVENSNFINSTATISSSNNSTASACVKTTRNETLTSATSTFQSCLPIGIGIEGQHNFEKSRRAVILLKRCDEREVQESSPSSGSTDREDVNDPSMSSSGNQGARVLPKERRVRQRKRKGKSGIQSAKTGSVKTEHICHFCSKFFTVKSLLTKHMRTHTREKPFGCDYCSKKFSQKWSAETHMRVHTGVKLFECQLCPKKFSQRTHLVMHVRVHTGVKPFECQLCRKKFSRKSHLESHLRVHTGVQPYECEYCSRKFSHRVSLTVHTRVHTGEKPYECQFCPRQFTNRSNILAHLNSHTGEKPYQCQLCSKRFSTPSNMKTHFIVHTKEKPYKCMLCPKTFKSNATLKLHLRGHARGRPRGVLVV